MISRVNHHQKMSFSKCMLGDIFLLILLVAADQGAKWLSYLYLKGQPSVSLIPGVLELHYLYPENRGIAFGMFQGSVLFFAIVSVLFLGVILYAWIRIPKERFYLPLLTIATVLAAGCLLYTSPLTVSMKLCSLGIYSAGSGKYRCLLSDPS